MGGERRWENFWKDVVLIKRGVKLGVVPGTQSEVTFFLVLFLLEMGLEV